MLRSIARTRQALRSGDAGGRTLARETEGRARRGCRQHVRTASKRTGRNFVCIASIHLRIAFKSHRSGSVDFRGAQIFFDTPTK
jgi:hypothetical protein